MKFRVFDTEGVGLNHKATKLHNFCYTEDGTTFNYTTDYDEMREWLSHEGVIWVCHNLICHDWPAIKAVLGVEMSYKQAWDTLALSWALFPERPKHGLEALGKEHGVEKVAVEEHEWEIGDPELMKERVIEDVKINYKEFSKQLSRLYEIYGKDNLQEILRYVRYLSFRMDVGREKQENPIKLDVELCKSHIKDLGTLIDEKTVELEDAMPKKVIEHTRPVRYKKKDGTLGVAGVKWDEKCEKFGQPKGCQKFLEYVNGNPSSPIQVKDWLYSLGWKPQTFKYTRNKVTGEEKRIEQVRKDGLLCPSVQELVEIDPAIEKLDGLTVLTHRKGVLEGFIKNEVDGYVVASAGGFTNTLRFQHRAPIVNIPGVEAKYGRECREVLVAGEGKVMVGADVSSLEDTLKQHFIQPLDPDYVEEMNVPGFDPHLSLGVFANRITQDDYDFFVSCKDESDKRYKSVKSVRKPLKTVNYACQYQVGSKTLSRNSGMSVSEAQELIDIYWEKNWAVKEVSKNQHIKTLKNGSMYLKNPINGYYYSLRNERDIFSTLVQGSGDYCFNVWLMNCRKLGLKVSMDYHDEWLCSVPEDQADWVKGVAKKAMDMTNDMLKLNVTLKMDVQVGNNYASVH